MNFEYVKGVKVANMQKAPAIKPHVKDPIRYPKVQCGYENLAQAIFVTQTNNMFQDVVKEMMDLK